MHGVVLHTAVVFAFEIGAEVFLGVQNGSIFVVERSAGQFTQNGVGPFELDGPPFAAHSELETAFEIGQAFEIQNTDVGFGEIGIVHFDGAK